MKKLLSLTLTGWLAVLAAFAQDKPASLLPAFGAEGRDFTTKAQGGKTIKGWLPTGWDDNSEWATLAVAYTKLADAPKGETGVRIEGSNAYHWLFHSAQAVVHTASPTRGAVVVREMMDGHRPAVWISDRYTAQQGHAAEHQTCLAHLARVGHVRGDARQHLGRADGLGDVVGGSKFETEDDVHFFGSRRHHNDGH